VRDALHNRHCATCRAFHQTDPKENGVCVLGPPTPMVDGVIVQSNVLDPKGGQKTAPRITSYYPPVSPRHGCLRHELAAEFSHLHKEEPRALQS
jgi:hypothetical protein